MITGWVVNGAPAVAPAGWVVRASLFAAAGVTEMAFWVPVIVVVIVSVAIRFSAPAVFRVTAFVNVWVPLSAARKL